MSHKSVRELIQDTVKSLADNIYFYYGRGSDFNQQQNKPEGILVNLALLSATQQYAVDGVSNYVKIWRCTLAFYKFDTTGSDSDEYQLILDETSVLVDKFLNKLNFYSEQADYIRISDINENPFVKTLKDILTGHLVEFTIETQDDFDYCAIDCVISGSNDC